MDILNVPALQRLGAAPNRVGFAFRSPTDPDYESYYQQSVKKLREFKAAGLPVIVEFGHETPMEGKIQLAATHRNLKKRVADGLQATSLAEAAEVLGLDQATLYRKRKKLGLE